MTETGFEWGARIDSFMVYILVARFSTPNAYVDMASVEKIRLN